jgi:hypothetical protein
MKNFWEWLNTNYQAIGVILTTISLAGAAISIINAQKSGAEDDSFKRKRETLYFMLQYTQNSKGRTTVVNDPRLSKFFDKQMAIDLPTVEDVEEDKISDDKKLRDDLSELVSYYEILCMGRQESVLDKTLFDLQFKEFLKSEHDVLTNFLRYTVKNDRATYPYWKAALKDYGVDAAGLTP